MGCGTMAKEKTRLEQQRLSRPSGRERILGHQRGHDGYRNPLFHKLKLLCRFGMEGFEGCGRTPGAVV